MQILLIDNTGGYADRIEVSDGMTVTQLFEEKVPGSSPRTTSSASTASGWRLTRSSRPAAA